MDDRAGIRTWLIASYHVGTFFVEHGFAPLERRYSLSPVRWVEELGCTLWCLLGEELPRTRRKRTMIDVDALVKEWHKLVVGLAMAHDKDDADRFEAAIDQCLQPILKAPVKQLREFAGKLRDALKADPKVPYLVWHAYEVWIERIVLLAPDEAVKELKIGLAQEIVAMVEDDARRDLPAAMVRALQWRSPEQLERVKDVVAAEKAEGRPARMRGRESCLFLEVGGSEDQPAVCIQI